VGVASLHALNDQRRVRIAGSDQACIWNAEITLERLRIAGVGVGKCREVTKVHRLRLVYAVSAGHKAGWDIKQLL